jgi:hypothetical protein
VACAWAVVVGTSFFTVVAGALVVEGPELPAAGAETTVWLSRLESLVAAGGVAGVC